MKRPQHTNNFDGVRLLLALFVLLGHQYRDMQWAADAAVLSFFVLSGLLVSSSWLADPHPWRFFQRRFLRIWPALAVVVIVCAASAYGFASGPWMAMQRLASVFYLRNLWLHVFDWSFFPGRPAGMNGSLWTLPFEVDLYGALALVGLLGRRALFVVAPLVWAAAFAAVPTVAAQTQLGEAWSLYFAGFFFAGICLARWPGLMRPSIAPVALGLGIGLLACGQVNAGQLFLVPIVTVAIGSRSWMGLRSMSRFGDLSYGVYIWAWPIQQVTRLWLPANSPLWLQLVVVVPQVLLMAFASWHLVEKRALRLKPRASHESRGDDVRPWYRLEMGSLQSVGKRLSSLFGRPADKI